MSADQAIDVQLREVFGDRLKMIAAFGDASVCAVVDRISVDDLDACARLFATRPPLLIAADELARALDAFPLEFGEILATRRVIHGPDLLAALEIPPADMRRACEAQARSHLLHLREGYIQAGGKKPAIARLLEDAAVPFRALTANVARLAGTTADELRARLELSGGGYAAALRLAERLVEYVDRWSTS